MSDGAQTPWHTYDDEAVTEAKEAMRREVRARRSRLSPRRRDEIAHRLAEVVLTIPQVADARCASVYASRPSEPGTGPLLDALSARGVRLLLPVLGTGLQRSWAVYAGPEDLRERAPGRPPEPGGETLDGAALGEADVVLVPALQVDASGVRLGQGGGWYDRVLEHARPGVPLVALVDVEELVDGPLPRSPHDRRVTHVATPDGWRAFADA